MCAKRSKSVTQCSARNSNVCAGFVRVHSLLLWSHVIEQQHADNSQFPIIVGCLEKSNKSLITITILFLPMRHNHLENEKEI